MVSYKTRKGKGDMGAPSEEFAAAQEGVDFPDNARYLLVGTAGTATLKRVDGTVVADVPLEKGFNLLACRQVVSLGTAADVFYCL